MEHPQLDTERLTQLMAGFESGADLPGYGVFEASRILLKIADGPIRAFLEGCTVPDTLEALGASATDDPDVLFAFALAGFLQGLAIGQAYAYGSIDR